MRWGEKKTEIERRKNRQLTRDQSHSFYLGERRSPVRVAGEADGIVQADY
jgi:hypothetical protein